MSFIGLSFHAKAQETMKGIQAYQWKHRLILLFSPSSDYQPLIEQQQRLNRDTTALIERDLLVFGILSDTEHDREAKSSSGLRQQFGVAANSFAIILIGKDGGEKLRRHAPIATEELFALIDAMPMRRQEIRSQH